LVAFGLLLLAVAGLAKGYSSWRRRQLEQGGRLAPVSAVVLVVITFSIVACSVGTLWVLGTSVRIT
jgi:hypothetical protein